MKDTALDLILESGTAVLPEGTHKTRIGIKGGRITHIGDVNLPAAETIDCTGLHILPGVIDTQVHFREPGPAHKEDLEHGMKAAALGGVTGIFEMPNTTPLTTTPEALQDKLERAAHAATVDYAFYFGGTAENAENLPAWENLKGVCGIKIFMGSSTGSLLSASDEDVRKVLQNGRRIVAVHAEDEMIMAANKAKMIAGDTAPVTLHPKWRSVESSVSAVSRLLRLAREAGRRVHVLHVSCAEEVALLSSHKDIATVEVLPNHLTLAAPECYERLGTHAQQNPPIREQYHQDALWAAIANGTIDMIGSDHAPHTQEEKSKPYPQSPSGTPGVQTMVPVMLNHVNNGRLSLERLVDLFSYGPQRIHQIAGKGRIACGYDADFTIVDLKAQKTITNAQQASKAGWTPYDGLKVTGWPAMAVVRGHIVMRDDALTGIMPGTPIRFLETL